VIHTVGPVWGEGDEERKLRSAVRSALEVADSLKLSSVSLPAISTGIFGYPKEEGVRVIVDEVIKYVKKGTGLREIRLVGYDELTAQLFAKEIARSKEVS
jgi:O-acetyl-ADP-ribose deacetylase (regulator of RNase III)